MTRIVAVTACPIGQEASVAPTALAAAGKKLVGSTSCPTGIALTQWRNFS
jgi:fructose-specific phosphotransferase system component IIB